MASTSWPLLGGRPIIEIALTLVQGGQNVKRTVLADTGAGNARAPFELLLDENDCLLCGRPASRTTTLRGAYVGSYPLYLIRVEIPILSYTARVVAVGVHSLPPNLDGIAGFRFLNRFTYGNFGNPSAFALET